jgi:hypothetical protein
MRTFCRPILTLWSYVIEYTCLMLVVNVWGERSGSIVLRALPVLCFVLRSASTIKCRQRNKKQCVPACYTPFPFQLLSVLQNQMAELFESIIYSRWFLRVSIISFLNKIDLFKSKLPKVHLRHLLFIPN